MEAIEECFSGAKRFEVFTGDKSQRHIIFYGRLGYKVFKREKISEKRGRVYLEKVNND